MDLSRYLKIGLRWWWLMLLSLVLSATASYIYSQRLPRIYAAKATLLVGTSVVETLNPNERSLGLSRTLAEVYSQLARRKIITRAVVERLGLEMDPDQLGGMIQTNIIPSAQLLEISVLDIHPQRAQLLANAVAEELIFQSPTGSQDQQERESFIQQQLQELQVKIGDTNDRIKELEDSMGNLTSAVEIAEAQAKLAELEELKSNYQNNYTQFLSNLSEASPNKLTIFEPASEPTRPISPDVRMNVMIAAVAGLALAVGAIIFLEFFDDTLVWQPDETPSILGLPILGGVGKVTGGSRIAVQDDLWSADANTLRNLRSSIFLTVKKENLSTLLVTSSTLGEGKSFLAVNLAAIAASPTSSIASVIASPGARVILIDTDLRRPSLHEIFDMPNLLGLADVLATPDPNLAQITLQKALKPTEIDNLRLLPAGRTPLDPGSLLNSPRFSDLLDLLRAQADIVLLDSAPILGATETAFVAKAVDATILVVSDGQTRRRTLQRAIEYLNLQDGVSLLGIVFNRVSRLSSYQQTYSYTPPQTEQLGQTGNASTGLKSIWPFGQKQPAETDLLSLNEVAEYFGVSQETAERWCEQGRLTGVKEGKRWMVSLEDLNEFIEAYQHSSVDNKPGQQAEPFRTGPSEPELEQIDLFDENRA